MINMDEYQKERAKLLELFAKASPEKLKLIEGLIDEAAYLKANNDALKIAMVETGMVKIHPQHKDIQKPVETAKQYLKNVNSYAVIIKTISSILQRSTEDDDDEFDKWLEAHRGG